MIKRINFVWVNDNDIPKWAVQNVARYRDLNPNYEVKLHAGDANSLKRHLCKELLDTWETTYSIHGQMQQIIQGDLLKLSIARRLGGWSIDVDTWPFYPMDRLINVFKTNNQIGGTFALCLFYTEPEWSGWDALIKSMADTPIDGWCTYSHTYWRSVLAWQKEHNVNDVLQRDDTILNIFYHPAALIYQKLLNGKFIKTRFVDVSESVSPEYGELAGQLDLSKFYFITGHQNIAPLPEIRRFLPLEFILP